MMGRAILVSLGMALLLAAPGLQSHGPSDGGSALQADEATVALLKDWDARPHVDLGMTSPPGGVLVVAFVDWLAPTCATTRAHMLDLAAKYRSSGKTLQYVTKAFPMDSACNPSLKGRVFRASCDAAVAAAVAQRLGRENEAIEWLSANSRAKTATPENVRSYVQKTLGVVDFQAEYERTMKVLSTDIELAGKLGVQGVPWHFINGVSTFSGHRLLPADSLDVVIAHEFAKRAGAGAPRWLWRE